MNIKSTEFSVEDETATHDYGAIVELELHVTVRTEYEENRSDSISVFKVVFERRGQSGPLHWSKVVDQGSNDCFGPTYCAVVLHAADYVEDHYGEDVDTKQISQK